MTEQVTITQNVCYNHPNRETNLRCNRCERYICISCAVLTPTGYRCKECVKGLQKSFDTAQWYDYPLVLVIAATLAFLGSLAAQVLGFFTIFLAPVIGVFIAEAVRWSVRKRRSRLLWQIATGSTILGAIPLLLADLLGVFFSGSPFALISLLWPAIYTFLVASTVYYRLSGIQIR